jgi:hypothetical protein
MLNQSWRRRTCKASSLWASLIMPTRWLSLHRILRVDRSPAHPAMSFPLFMVLFYGRFTAQVCSDVQVPQLRVHGVPPGDSREILAKARTPISMYRNPWSCGDKDLKRFCGANSGRQPSQLSVIAPSRKSGRTSSCLRPPRCGDERAGAA